MSFYETLGFNITYRQIRPNPYAVVALEDIQIHLFGIEGFNPEESYGSVIIAVPDPESLYRVFAAKLRERFGKLPILALKTLESGLERFVDAAAIDRARAYLYRVELAVRTSNPELVRSSLAAADSLELTDAERAAIAEYFAHAKELVDLLWARSRGHLTSVSSGRVEPVSVG